MKYDLHVHTHFSRCSNMHPREILRIAKERGLNGIAITDHNTMQGALATAKLNQDPNFEVIIGSEIKTEHGEILGLYLNEDIESREFFEVINEIHKQGGIAIIAHPTAKFRSKLKHPCIELQERINGIEGFNSRALLSENGKAQRIGLKFGFGLTGGSDAHFYYEIGRGYTEFDGNLKKAIKNCETRVDGSILYAVIGGSLSAFRKFVFR